ncbi:MAG: hypothetical protein LBL87_01840 [Ruminococcus sp.]|jgi:hypothetical protein|nr:hypothetical protein [Ruminococcus sp.]
MIVVLIIGILVTASLVAGALLDFPLTNDIAFWSLAALTALLTVSVFVSRRRKGRLRSANEEKDNESELRAELEKKLEETEKELEAVKKTALTDRKTAKKFLTLVSMLLRVSPADAHTLLLRTIRFFVTRPSLEDDEKTVFTAESLITDTFASALCGVSAGMPISINIPDSFPAKLCGPEELIRSALSETAEAVALLPPQAVNIDIDFTDRGESLEIRFIFEAVGLPLSKGEADILTGAVSRGGAGGSLHSAKTIAESLGGSFEIKRRGEGTLFTVIFPLSHGGGGVIGNSAARGIAALRFLQCDFDYMPYGRVLICDSNPRSRIAYADLFLLHGLKTYTAADCESAVKLIRAGENFGVVFFDTKCGDSSAPLRESGYDGVVIAVTDDDLSKDDLSGGGFDGFIKKPCDFHIIESVLRQFIVSRQPPAVIAAATYTRSKTIREKAPPVQNTPVQNIPAKDNEPTFEETLSALERLPSPESAPQNTDEPSPKTEPETPQFQTVELPRITTNVQGISKTEFTALADEIFIKLYETMDSDLKEFAAQAKLIKNACADIGNTDLTAKARALEFAAKDGKTAFIGEFTPEFLSDLKRYADSLSQSPQSAPLVSAAVKNLAVPPEIKNTPPILPVKPPVQPVQPAQAAPPEQNNETAPQSENAPESEPEQAIETDETAETPEENSLAQTHAALETIMSACEGFDSARALEAAKMIDTDSLDAMSHGLVEEIKSLISIGELAEAAEMAENLLDDLKV